VICNNIVRDTTIADDVGKEGSGQLGKSISSRHSLGNTIFASQSTTTRIVVKPDAGDFGKSVMKSMVTPSSDRDGLSTGVRIACLVCQSVLIQWNTSQPLTYLGTCDSIAG
jgi:hypothetical protein